jgi:hypothetical protein
MCIEEIFMKTRKKGGLALAAAGLISALAQASEAQVNHLPAAAFSQADIHAMFKQTGKPVEVATLSSVEMKETEGAFLLNTIGWTVLGGAVGTGAYLVYTPTSQWNAKDAGISFATGATGGFYNSVLPMRAFGTVGSYIMGGFGAASVYSLLHGQLLRLK